MGLFSNALSHVAKPLPIQTFSQGFMHGVNTIASFGNMMSIGNFANMMTSMFCRTGLGSSHAEGMLQDIRGMIDQRMNKMDNGQDSASSCCYPGMPEHGLGGGLGCGGIGGHDPLADNLHEKLAFSDFNAADKAKGSLFQSKAEAKKEHLDKGLDTLERDGYDVNQYRELVEAAAGDAGELDDIAKHLKELLAPHL